MSKVRHDRPENYEQLKAAANRTSSWRERLAAVEELGRYHTEAVVGILRHRLQDDPVYAVQEAAFKKLKAMGEAATLPPRKKGELVKGANKVFVRVRKSLPEGHAFEEFKEKLKKMRLDVYDAYEGEKGKEFDTWLEAQWGGTAAN